MYVRLGAAKVEVSHLDSCYDILTLVLSKDIQGIVRRIHMYLFLYPCGDGVLLLNNEYFV